jgi:hypothetical protein
MLTAYGVNTGSKGFGGFECQRKSGKKGSIRETASDFLGVF